MPFSSYQMIGVARYRLADQCKLNEHFLITTAETFAQILAKCASFTKETIGDVTLPSVSSQLWLLAECSQGEWRYVAYLHWDFSFSSSPYFSSWMFSLRITSSTVV